MIAVLMISLIIHCFLSSKYKVFMQKERTNDIRSQNRMVVNNLF